MSRNFLRTAALAATAILASASLAHASATSGSLWLNDPNASDASIVPSGPADATFATGAINYQSQSGGYTIGGFLNNPVFNNQSANFISAGGANAPLDNTFIQITGTIGLLSGANSFVVAHDDGVVLSVAGFGTVLSQPGPTGESFTPFNINNPGPAGNFAFTLNYTECCGPPADLVLQINNVTIGGAPEPASWALTIVGVAGVGAALRSRRRKVVAA